MSSETLSQSEIDRLLGGSSSAIATPAAHGSELDVQVYDFRRPHRVSKERLRTIEAMYERLAKSLEGWLIGRVRRQVVFQLVSVEQYSFGEFAMSLSMPCASFCFDIANAEGQKGVIDVGHEFAYFLVDRFFGGAASVQAMNRPLTPIERLAIQTVVERAAALLTEIWEDHIALELRLTSFESSPDMLQVAGREDPVLVANIEVSADGQSSMLLLCLPFMVLERFFTSDDRRKVKQIHGTEGEITATRELAELSVRATHVDVAARLPAFRVPIRQLVGLPVGAVLSTGVAADAPLELHIAGRPRYRAAPGRVGEKLAVRLCDATPAPAPPLSETRL